MYPVLIVLAFSATLLLRRKLFQRERQRRLHELRPGGLPLALLFQPYTFFLLVLVVCYSYLVCLFGELVVKYNWLDPTTFKLEVHFPKDAPGVGVLEDYVVPSWLRGLSVGAPLCVGATFAVTVAHLRLHLPQARGFEDHLRWFPSYSHDLAMQVVCLPLVYGVFALYSLYTMLSLVTGDAFSGSPSTSHQVLEEHWNLTVTSVQRTYETSFELADLYEAWALRAFGLLCFALVGRQISLETPTVKHIIDTVREHQARVACAQDQGILGDLTILNDPHKFLFMPLQQTSYIGIRVFVLTYAAKSAYMLTLGILQDQFEVELCGSRGRFPAACSFTDYVSGAAFLASCLAIYNIVVFEHNLKEILSKDRFRPFEKFLSVKIMVSIAFFQDAALSILLGSVLNYHTVQINLCYASLICCEVLALSVIVLAAWKPVDQDWYAGDCYIEMEEAAERRGQLADECGSAQQRHPAFLQRRQLTAGVPQTPAVGDELTAIIELRGDVRGDQGRALEDMINTLSATVRARYKPAALFRCRSLGLSSDASATPLSGAGW